MSSLKEILVKNQIEIVLKDYFSNLNRSYESVSNEEKVQITNLISPEINRDVDKMLREYVETVQASTPDKKITKHLK